MLVSARGILADWLALAALTLLADWFFEFDGGLSPVLVLIQILAIVDRRDGSRIPLLVGLLVMALAELALAFSRGGFDRVVAPLAVIPTLATIPLLLRRFEDASTDLDDQNIENQRLERELLQRDANLELVTDRYEKLFSVSHISFSEQSFDAARPVFEKMRMQNVTDFRAYMADHPDELAYCVGAVRVERVNDAMTRMLGYESMEELAAKPPLQNAETAFAILTDQLELAFYGGMHLEGRTTLIGKDDRRIPIFYSVNRLSETRQLTSNLDLSQFERANELQLAAQEELARANRVASMGALSASLTHELNQPILSMLLDTQNGLRWLDADPPNIEAVEKALTRLKRTAERAADIVKTSRARISLGKQALTAVDVPGLIEETVELLQREISNRGVEISVRLAPAIPAVQADRVGLQQVLVNFIMNAMEAMASQDIGHRLIEIEAGIVPDDPGLVWTRVSDNGPGIDDAHLKRIFEPFFTTKAGGVGLGLQICRSTIESFGGNLNVSNRAPSGAVFEFELAVADPGEALLPASEHDAARVAAAR